MPSASCHRLQAEGLNKPSASTQRKINDVRVKKKKIAPYQNRSFHCQRSSGYSIDAGTTSNDPFAGATIPSDCVEESIGLLPTKIQDDTIGTVI